MQYFKYMVVPLIALVLICGVVSSAGSAEAKSKTFKLKVNLHHADSLSGKILIKFLAGVGQHLSKKVDVGKLAQQLDTSEIFNKISLTIKKSWFAYASQGDYTFEVCAYSYKLGIQKCTTQDDNHKKTQTILVKVPNEGDRNDDGDF
jgi:hypothetical protein